MFLELCLTVELLVLGLDLVLQNDREVLRKFLQVGRKVDQAAEAWLQFRYYFCDNLFTALE